MPQVQPEQAHFLLHGLYLPGLKNEQAITRRVIEAIPADKGDYRPDAVSKTAMELAWHIVAAEMRFLEAAATGTFDMGPRPKPDSIQNSADLSAWYTENFNRRLEALTKLTDEQLVKIIDFRGIMQVPAVMILNIQMHHSAHHRGQLSVYLRPMGAKVPSIYGESYDAAEARKAAQKA